MAQIFISYSRADQDFIQRLEPRFRRKYGDEFWYDAEILGGDVWWEDTIMPAIASCIVFVYLLSNDAISSEYCRKEMAEAQRLSKKILPVIVRPKTLIPEDLQVALGSIQYVNMEKGINDETITDLYASIDNLLAKINQRPRYSVAEGLEARRTELAIRVGVLAVRFRDQFEGALSPITFSGEAANREMTPDESPEDTHRLNEGYVRSKRLQPAAETLDELVKASWEAEIILGKNLDQFLMEYRTVLNKITSSIQVYFYPSERGSISYSGPATEDHFKREEKLHGTIYDIDGVLRKQVRETTSRLKGLLESYLSMWNTHRTGDIYWLASDLTIAIPLSKQGAPDQVSHYVRQTYWHASQLKLGDPIEERFAQLCEKTNSFRVEDWNDPKRRDEVASELGALLHAIAFVMEGEDKEFRGNPPDGWGKC